jgi:Zn-dependent protease
MFERADMIERLLSTIVLVLSLTVHEWAHAFSAFKLGDDTAERQGRLTLNPIAHIDPIGTLLLPLMGVPFGWAKPVPVNASRFRRGVNVNTGMMITSVAGPLSNVVLAFICALVYLLLDRFQPQVLTEAVVALLYSGVGLNIVLAVFNMLPIPPLDGSRVVEGLLPYRYRTSWESFTRYAPLLLLLVIMLPGATSTLLGPPREFLENAIVQSARWLVGA